MERLTFEGNFCDIAMCRENPCPYNGSCSQKETWERLKAYEDAEAEGRLVVLPCKVGDTVYFRTYAKNATVDLGIQPHKVITYRLGMVIEGNTGVPETVLPDYEFGRTVFLTREEAEEAPKGESDG